MVEVKIESIRVSLMSQHRVVILKDVASNRYLPIWIDAFVAEAITIHLQEQAVARPLTHDLAIKLMGDLGGALAKVVINDLRNDTFFAQLFVQTASGKEVIFDARPSDAIALAVRAACPIFVEDDVMNRAGVVPDDEEKAATDDDLGAFKDFLGSLDLDDLEKNN